MTDQVLPSLIQRKVDELKGGRTRCATYHEKDSVRRIVEDEGYGVSQPIQDGGVWVLTLTMDPDGDGAA